MQSYFKYFFQSLPSQATSFALVAAFFLFNVGHVSPAWSGTMVAQTSAQSQSSGGVHIGSDPQSGDALIRVGPSGTTTNKSKIVIGKDPDSGDRLIHVVPPAEKQHDNDVRYGPLVIIPEITLPGPGKPAKIR